MPEATMDEDSQLPTGVCDIGPTDVPAPLIIYPPMEPVSREAALPENPPYQQLWFRVLACVGTPYIVDRGRSMAGKLQSQ